MASSTTSSSGGKYLQLQGMTGVNFYNGPQYSQSEWQQASLGPSPNERDTLDYIAKVLKCCGMDPNQIDWCLKKDAVIKSFVVKGLPINSEFVDDILAAEPYNDRLKTSFRDTCVQATNYFDSLSGQDAEEHLRYVNSNIPESIKRDLMMDNDGYNAVEREYGILSSGDESRDPFGALKQLQCLQLELQRVICQALTHDKEKHSNVQAGIILTTYQRNRQDPTFIANCQHPFLNRIHFTAHFDVLMECIRRSHSHLASDHNNEFTIMQKLLSFEISADNFNEDLLKITELEREHSRLTKADKPLLGDKEFYNMMMTIGANKGTAAMVKSVFYRLRIATDVVKEPLMNNRGLLVDFINQNLNAGADSSAGSGGGGNGEAINSAQGYSCEHCTSRGRRSNHLSSQCWFQHPHLKPKSKYCDFCKKPTHNTSECRSKNNESNKRKSDTAETKDNNNGQPATKTKKQERAHKARQLKKLKKAAEKAAAKQ